MVMIQETKQTPLQFDID